LARVEVFGDAAVPEPGLRQRLHLPHLHRAPVENLQAAVLTHRVRVSRVKLFSVARIALVFYFAVGCAAIVATLLLWKLLDNGGVVPNVEKFIGELASEEDFHFTGSVLFRSAVLAIASFVLFATSLTVLAAALYNLMAPVVGGIDVVLDERPATEELAREAVEDSEVQQLDVVRSNGHADGAMVLKS
jgi:hypothetical protein